MIQEEFVQIVADLEEHADKKLKPGTIRSWYKELQRFEYRHIAFAIKTAKMRLKPGYLPSLGNMVEWCSHSKDWWEQKKQQADKEKSKREDIVHSRIPGLGKFYAQKAQELIKCKPSTTKEGAEKRLSIWKQIIEKYPDNEIGQEQYQEYKRRLELYREKGSQLAPPKNGEIDSEIVL